MIVVIYADRSTEIYRITADSDAAMAERIRQIVLATLNDARSSDHTQELQIDFFRDDAASKEELAAAVTVVPT